MHTPRQACCFTLGTHVEHCLTRQKIIDDGETMTREVVEQRWRRTLQCSSHSGEVRIALRLSCGQVGNYRRRTNRFAHS